MFTNIKSILFSVFKNISKFLFGTGVGRLPFSRVVYDYLFQYLSPTTNIIEVQGSKMYLNVHEPSPSLRRTFQAYALNLIHEEYTTKIFENIVKEGDIAIDCGANIGYFTLLFAKLVGKEGKVYAFEAEPRNYNLLARNIKLNGYSNAIATHKAVSNENGFVKLYIHPEDTGHHTINQYNGLIDDKRNFVNIEATSLDEFFKETNCSIDVIKMDIEGSEPLAFSGMDNIIRGSKNLKIILEFYPLFIKEMGLSPEEFIQKLLEDYQFSMFVIRDEYDGIKGKYKKITSVDEIMNLCKRRNACVNLFLEKGTKIFEKLII